MEHRLDPARLGDHLDRLYRAAWALSGSREDAEDLVQETYARVLARPRLLRNEDDLGYLLRALRNTFLKPANADAPTFREYRLRSFVKSEIDDAFASLDTLGQELHAEERFPAAGRAKQHRDRTWPQPTP